MMKKLLFLLIPLLILALLITTVGCGDDDDEATATPTKAATTSPTQAAATPTPKPITVKIGVLCALTGPAAFWGASYPPAIELAMDEINDAGGLVIDGQQYFFDYVAYDDQYTATEAVKQGKKLIDQDKVKFIIGPMGSTGMIALNPTITEDEVIMFGYGSSYERFGPEYPYTFGMGPGGKEYNLAIYEYVAQTYPELKTYVGIAGNDDSGWADADLNPGRVEAHGIEVLGFEMFEPGTKDFYPLLAKVLDKDPDIVDTCSSQIGDAALIWKQLRELGYEGLIISSGSGGSASYVLSIAGEEGAEGVIMPWPNWLSEQYVLDSEKEFMAKMDAKAGAGKYDTSSAIAPYDAVYILVEAMKLAGSVDDVPAIAAKMNEVDLLLPDGEMSWGGAETFGIACQVIKDTVISTFENGEQMNIGRLLVPLP